MSRSLAMRTWMLLLLACCSGPKHEAPDGGALTADDVDVVVTTDAEVGAAICADTNGGAYCGGDHVANADPDTLYECPVAGEPPTSAQACPAGCKIEPSGTEDRCITPTTAKSYRLPWRPATTMRLTQDCNDSCCSDHVGNDKYAYDWANGGGFGVVAARAGTITHLKINSTTGCASSSCSQDANYLVIDHGDGTQSTYFHLKGNSLAAGITCGATVTQGQALATSGTTGHSTGVHLHFQVSKVHPAAPTCECGANGKGCSASSVPYADFWVTSTYPSVAVKFDDWPTSASCSNRRIQMPVSDNE
ncbi:MAG: M23 family metallopeptidase [Kofleriaceae bacterium]